MSESLGTAVLDLAADPAGVFKGLATAHAESLKGAAKTSAGYKKVLAAGLAAAGVAGAAALSAGLVKAISVEKANDKLTAQLGANAKQSERLGRIAGDLYSNAYGGSIDDVNQALRGVVQNVKGLGKTSDRELKNTTKGVLNLASTFDQDLGGVTRAVGQLMRTGLAKNSRQALDILTRGFQTGGDKAEDLLDTVNEYSTEFRNVGLTGGQMMGVISQGLQAGARDADKVADAIKEFSIRAVDGSKLTRQGFKQLGLDGQKMAERIGKGGPVARKALDEVLDRLRGMKDPVKQSQAAVALFGTQAEDLGKALYAIDPSQATDRIGKLSGAADRLDKTINDNVSTTIETFKRQALQGLSEFAGRYAIPALSSLLSTVGALIGPFHSLAGPVAAIAVALAGTGGLFFAIVKVRAAFVALKAAMLANPYVAVAAATIAIGVLVYKHWGAIRDFIVGAWGTVKTATRNAWGWVKDHLGTILPIIVGLITGPIGLAVLFIVTHWKQIKDKTRETWQAVKGAITGAVSSAVTWVKGAVRDVRDWLVGAWGTITTGAASGWGAVKTAILNPIKSALDWIHGAINDVRSWLKGRWDDIAGVFRKGKDTLLDAITLPFRLAVRGIARFAKLILQVVDKIPGVDMKGPIGKVDNLLASVKGLARGGAYGRTGGMVNAPIVMMGEEAPRHPEFVIPTNPAYRKRARGLLGMAANALGMATGGVFGFNELQNLWISQGGPSGQSKIAAAVALAESAGNRFAVGPSTPYGRAKGLWQILGQVVPGDIFDAVVNARNAVRKFLDAGGWSPWEAFTNGRYRQFLGGKDHPGILGAINPLQFIRKLPGVSDLPDWIKGLGSNVLGQVKDWIAGKIKGLIGGIIGGKVPGWGVLDGLAQRYGLSITSTYRPGDDGWHGQLLGVTGRAHATDYSNSTGPTPQMLSFARAVAAQFGSQIKELIYTPLGFGIKNGQRVGMDFPFPWAQHYNHVHVAFREGGVYGGLPFLGSYHAGGVAPAEGLAHVLEGERMTPAGRGDGPLVNVERMVVTDGTDVDLVSSRLAFLVTT